jgi:hypothetical protein
MASALAVPPVEPSSEPDPRVYSHEYQAPLRENYELRRLPATDIWEISILAPPSATVSDNNSNSPTRRRKKKGGKVPNTSEVGKDGWLEKLGCYLGGYLKAHGGEVLRASLFYAPPTYLSN